VSSEVVKDGLLLFWTRSLGGVSDVEGESTDVGGREDLAKARVSREGGLCERNNDVESSQRADERVRRKRDEGKRERRRQAELTEVKK